jgi:hypothetical protein
MVVMVLLVIVFLPLGLSDWLLMCGASFPTRAKPVNQ